MFRGFGTWLGFENPTFTKPSEESEEQEEKVVEAQNEVNKQQPAEQDGEPETNQENPEQNKGLGGQIQLLSLHICNNIWINHSIHRRLFNKHLSLDRTVSFHVSLSDRKPVTPDFPFSCFPLSSSCLFVFFLFLSHVDNIIFGGCISFFWSSLIFMSSMFRLHLQFCLQCYKEDLWFCGGDSSDHQEVCGRREYWRHHRQGELLLRLVWQVWLLLKDKWRSMSVVWPGTDVLLLKVM